MRRRPSRLDRQGIEMPASPANPPPRSLQLLSIVIPARDEEGCIASTIEHLHLELSLHGVPHEIVVVDDGSTDSTWQILQGEAAKIPTLRPVQNPGPHGFERAITKGRYLFICLYVWLEKYFSRGDYMRNSGESC